MASRRNKHGGAQAQRREPSPTSADNSRKMLWGYRSSCSISTKLYRKKPPLPIAEHGILLSQVDRLSVQTRTTVLLESLRGVANRVLEPLLGRLREVDEREDRDPGGDDHQYRGELAGALHDRSHSDANERQCEAYDRAARPDAARYDGEPNAHHRRKQPQGARQAEAGGQDKDKRAGAKQARGEDRVLVAPELEPPTLRLVARKSESHPRTENRQPRRRPDQLHQIAPVLDDEERREGRESRQREELEHLLGPVAPAPASR